MIINHRRYDGLSRRGGSFKSGGDSYGVEIGPNNVLRVVDNGGKVLAENHDLPGDFAVQSISAELASGQLKVLCYCYGFTIGASDQERYVILIDGWVGSNPVY